jgi:hypothetical protein
MPEPKRIRVEAKNDDYEVEIWPVGNNNYGCREEFNTSIQGTRVYNKYISGTTGGQSEGAAENMALGEIDRRDAEFGEQYG